MSRTWRQRGRRLRFLLGGLVAAGLIGLAVLIGLVQLLLPLAAHYPDRIARLLSDRLQQPVHFASVDGHWQASGPLLVLHEVRIGGQHGATPLQFPVADVKLDFGALLIPRRRLVNLRLVDLHLDLERAADGTWSVGGIGAAGGKTSQRLDPAQLPGSLRLDRLRMDIHDVHSGRDWKLWSDHLRVSNDGTVVQFAGDLRRPDTTHGLGVVGRVDMGDDSGTVYIDGHGIDLGRLMAGLDFGGHGIDAGRGDLQAWLQWQHARVVAQTARVDLTGLALHDPAGKARIPRLKGLFGFRRDAHGWHVRFAADGGAAVRMQIQGAGDDRAWWMRSRHLDLGTLAPLAAQIPGMPSGLDRWLLGAAPRGQVDQAALRWSARHGLEYVDIGFRHLQLAADGARPGIGPLDGRLFGDHEALMLSLPAQSTVLRIPHTFRKPIQFKQLDGDIVAWHQGTAWHIGTARLAFGGTGFSGQARGEVRVPDAGGKPFMDLFVALGKTTVQAAKQFWPIDAMSPQTVAWLDRSLVDGYLAHAEALLRGNLADWPFKQHQGRFEARGETRDLTLAYNPNWPAAKGIHAIARFVDDGMLVTADAGTSKGIRTRSAVAEIPTFHDAQLILSVEGDGNAQDMLDFVRSSPIARKQASALGRLRLGGGGTFGFSLMLPLRNASQFSLGGTARMKNVDVDNPDWGLHLGKLGGTLRFDGKGLSGKGLAVRFNGVPSTLDLALGDGATGKSDHPVSVMLHGHYDVPTLVRGRDALAPLAKVASGTSDFDIGFDIDDAPGTPVRQVLSLDSSLQGIALDLPAPLDKPVNDALPLHMDLRLPVSGGDLRVALGGLVRARARLPGDDGTPLALSVMFGTRWPSALPARGIRIGGSSERLDVSGWLQRALAQSEQQGGHGPTLDGVDVRAAKARVFGATFDDMHLQLSPQPGQIQLRVDSPQAKGSLILPTQDLQKRGVLARLDRLYWPDEAAAKAEAEMERRQEAPSNGAAASSIDYADTGIDPASLPPLHISVGDLRLGKARLGQARFESWPTAKGMHIDQLRTHTSHVQIMGSGDWDGSAHDSHTRMSIDFVSDDLGSLLKALGFGGLFEGGRTSAHLQARWPGEPSSLAMQRMTGSLQVEVSKGRIPDVQPGMGRLLGLMALTELPRRLSLDFGDVFGKGLGFDSIKGQFQLEDGMAVTRNLKLKGSAAEITITGKTNLREKTYDQQILVVPHVGNSLPVVGAIAGGPVGAAAGLAIQGLLGRGLNKAASARYSLTGTWEKPKITLLEKTTARSRPAVPAAAGSAAVPAPAATIVPPAVQPALPSTSRSPAASAAPAPAGSTSGP